MAVDVTVLVLVCPNTCFFKKYFNGGGCSPIPVNAENGDFSGGCEGFMYTILRKLARLRRQLKGRGPSLAKMVWICHIGFSLWGGSCMDPCLAQPEKKSGKSGKNGRSSP